MCLEPGNHKNFALARHDSATSILGNLPQPNATIYSVLEPTLGSENNEALGIVFPDHY